MYIIIKKNSTFIFIHNSVKATSKVCISKMSEHVIIEEESSEHIKGECVIHIDHIRINISKHLIRAEHISNSRFIFVSIRNFFNFPPDILRFVKDIHHIFPKFLHAADNFGLPPARFSLSKYRSITKANSLDFISSWLSIVSVICSARKGLARSPLPSIIISTLGRF